MIRELFFRFLASLFHILGAPISLATVIIITALACMVGALLGRR